MAAHFNPPPTWPPTPPGWTPPDGWQPDPAWGPAPPGWQFWVEGQRAGRNHPVMLGLIAGGATLVLVVGVVVAAQPNETPTCPPGVAGCQAGPETTTPPVDTSPATTNSRGPSEPSEPSEPGADWPVATQFGIGDAAPGMTVSAVEDYLGTAFDEVEISEPDCTVLFDLVNGVGVVTSNDDVVQTYLIQNPAVRTADGVGVGSTYEEVLAAYPLWAAEPYDGYTTQWGGRFVSIEISASGSAPDQTSTGRHMLFEFDQEDRVAAYRVGAPPFVFLVEYCSTP